MIRIFTFLSLFFLAFSALGQTIYTGGVTDEKGEPLIGATVFVPSSTIGTVTDADGHFRLDAPANATLIFRYAGYREKAVETNGTTAFSVILEEDVALLEQIVVVGYGVQKKKDLTTAVVSVDEKAIRERPMVSAAEALQGKAAGVQVVQTSGKPGQDLSVRVRGATSVLAGNEPLYVVDGVPTTDIRGLNPQDIETMSVLKDASSATIYGARAANGVVLISTKKGKAGQSRIEFSSYAGFSDIRKTIDVLTTKQYKTLIDEIIPGALDPSFAGATDWQSEAFGIGKTQSGQLSFSGGTEKTQFLASMNYQNNVGAVAPARFDRYSARLNLDHQATNWLKTGVHLNILRSRTKDTPDNASSGRGGVIMSALNTPPILKTYKNDGSGQFEVNPFQPSWENPIAYMFGADQEATDARIFGNFTAEATIFNGFSVKTNFGADLNAHQWDYYLDPFRTNYGRDQNGLGQSEKSNTTVYLVENTANWKKAFGSSNLDFLVGQSVQKSSWSNIYVTGNDFPSDTSVTLLSAANNVQAYPGAQEWALASFFGRAQYDFESKYLFTASLRRDGSSKLAHKWGTMPAFSAGWRVSAEPFFPKTKAIDDLKIRGGWGRNGNQEGIANYAQFGLVNYFRRAQTNPLSGPGSYQASYGNPDLKWETTDQTNIGIDLSMWRGRAVFALDAYLKKTDDVLLNVQLPNTLPISFIQTNAGAIENRGLDFQVSTVNLEKRGLEWRTDFNISFNRNEVKRLDFTDVYYSGRIYSNNQDVAILREGLPLGTFFGYVAEGVNRETGDMIFSDLNENGILDPGDRTTIGNGNPDFVFGLTNNLAWKRWDLNVFFQGSYGNDVFNATRIDLEGMFDSKNQSVAVLNRWTPDNPDTDVPRAVGGGKVDNVRNSTRFVEDGSYLRMKQITLSYRLFGERLKKAGFSNATVYATGQNLLTLTKYSGFDPEVNAFGRSATELGIDYGTYPQMRTVIVGFNLGF